MKDFFFLASYVSALVTFTLSASYFSSAVRIEDRIVRVVNFASDEVCVFIEGFVVLSDETLPALLQLHVGM